MCALVTQFIFRFESFSPEVAKLINLKHLSNFLPFEDYNKAETSPRVFFSASFEYKIFGSFG